MEAGLDDPTFLRSYPLASLTELGLCESTTLSMGSTVLGIAESIVPIDVSVSSSVSCPSPPLSLPASSSVSAPPSSHIHGKRARKKVNSIMLKEVVVDHGVKSVTGVREGKSSAVPPLQTMTEEKRKSASEKTPLTDEIAVPVFKSSGDERKSLFFPASSTSTQNSEFQSDVSSTVKAGSAE